MWQTPLSSYMPYTLAEIRRLKTHGEKRVAIVLEVFHAVHNILQSPAGDSHLTDQLVPKFAVAVGEWITTALAACALPSADELRKHLALPLLAQAKIDVGEGICKLAEGRLGVKSKPQAVRAQSRKLGVTRARVYQLLDECGKAMAVRWPEGRVLLEQLAEKYAAAGASPDEHDLLAATRELFFPARLAEIGAT
jgi:hypothetical protein